MNENEFTDFRTFREIVYGSKQYEFDTVNIMCEFMYMCCNLFSVVVKYKSGKEVI